MKSPDEKSLPMFYKNGKNCADKFQGIKGIELGGRR